MKFTFKTEKSTGRYGSFYPDVHLIKLNKIVVGDINGRAPYQITLKIKRDGVTKQIKLAKESETLLQAKDFLNERFESLTSKYEFVTE